MLRNVGAVGDVAPVDPAQIEIHGGAALIIRFIAPLLQETQHDRRRRFALYDVQRSAVQDSQTDGGRVQHHVHRACRVALADLVVGDGVDLHGGISVSVPGQHPDDVGFLVADLGRIEMQLIGRMVVTITLLNNFPVQCNLNLI